MIAVKFREEGDALIGAALVSEADDLLLVSRKPQAIRFRGRDEQLRPMGRATSGVTGMKLRGGDELLSMAVVPAGWRRSAVRVHRDRRRLREADQRDEYRRQGRGGLGIKAMKVADQALARRRTRRLGGDEVLASRPAVRSPAARLRCAGEGS